MALSNLPIFPQTPKLGLLQFLQGTDVAGTYKTFYTGQANASKIGSLFATTSDSAAAHLVTIQLVRSAVLYGGCAVSVPLSSGFTAPAPPVNVLAQWPGLPVDSDGNAYLILQSGDLLQATFATALQAASVLNLTGVIGDF